MDTWAFCFIILFSHNYIDSFLTKFIVLQVLCVCCSIELLSLSGERNVKVEEDLSGDCDVKFEEGEDGEAQPKALHKTKSIFLRNLAATITKQEVETVSRPYLKLPKNLGLL